MERVRFIMIALVFNGICLCISFLGLQVLVGKVIKILGYLAFPFILLPLAVFAPKRIRENDCLNAGAQQTPPESL